MRRVSTVNSVYHINESEHLIRRIGGVNLPTPRQGEDGEWATYETIVQHPQGGLLIVWGENPDGTARCTWTSDVVLADGEAWDEARHE